MNNDNIKICTEMLTAWSIRLAEQLTAAKRISEARLVELYTEQAIEIAANVLTGKLPLDPPSSEVTPATLQLKSDTLINTLRSWRKNHD